MNQALQTYRKTEWNLGEHRIDEVQLQLQRLTDLTETIKYFEEKHQYCIEESIAFNLFPNLRQKYIHKADIAKRAAIRLRQTFNNLINEINI